MIVCFSQDQTPRAEAGPGRAALGAASAPSSRCCVFSSNPESPGYNTSDVIVLEIEVKGSAEPFQILLEPYALIIPGENYIGLNVTKDFRVGPARWCCPGSAVRGMWLEGRTPTASRLTEDGSRGAPGPAGFARMLGWTRQSLYQLPSTLQATGLGTPSCVHGSLAGPGAHKPCGVGLVLLERAGRVSLHRPRFDGWGTSFRCGTTASPASGTCGGRSATATSSKWSPARGPSVPQRA